MMATNSHKGDQRAMEWERFIDDAANAPYYHNSKTGETSWEIPKGFESYFAQENPSVEEQNQPIELEDNLEVEQAEEEEEDHRWVQYTDDDTGNEYFYDEITKQTQWERPKGYASPKASVEPSQEEEEEDEQQEEEEEEEEEEGEKEHEDTVSDEEQPGSDKKKEASNVAQDPNAETTAEPSDKSAASAPSHQKPSKWVKYVDSSSGKAYFHDTISGKTQWEEPKEYSEATPADSSAMAATREYQQWLARTRAAQIRQQSQKAIDPNGHLSRLNSILEGIDSNAQAKDSADCNKPPHWQQHIDPHSQKYYYYNVDTGQTQWERPSSPIASGLADWIPPVDPEAESKRLYQDKTVSGHHYVATAKFNQITGKYEQLGGEEYFDKAGMAPDKAGRQMSAFFDLNALEQNREEARRRKEQLRHDRSIDWKKINAEKKAKKQKAKNQWLFTD